MSAWAWVIAIAAYLAASYAIGMLATHWPLRPLRWLRRRRIAQHLADRCEFLGLDPDEAIGIYAEEVGGLWRIQWHEVHDAILAAHHRYLWREAVGYGLDVVSEVPARLVLSDPHHIVRAA